MDKKIRENNLPKISMALVGTFLISSILTLAIPKFGDCVLLYPSNLREPLSWYRLLTYPFYVGGLIPWFHNALVILLTGYIIEKRISRKDLIGLIILSCLIGGFLYILLNQGDIYDTPMASPTMISWGYWSAAIVIGLKIWKNLSKAEKVIMLLCVASMLSAWDENLGFFIGQLSVILIIAILTLIRKRER